MSCSICGRGNCTSMFHSIEEQEKHEELFGEYEDMIDELKDRIKELEKENVIYWDIMTHEQRIEVTKE